MRVEAKELAMSFVDGARTVRVFDNLNFIAEPGEAIAVVGQSGIGKTTLLYNLGGLERPTAGSVIIGDTDIATMTDAGAALAEFRGKHIGFIFQFHYLLPEFDALENVAMPLLIAGHTPEAANERGRELLARVGLSDRLTHRPGELSGGEQQRVAVARALAPRPGVILADEPTGNLDKATGDAVVGLLREMQKENGTTLIVVTHSQDVAAAMDRTVTMSNNYNVEAEGAGTV